MGSAVGGGGGGSILFFMAETDKPKGCEKSLVEGL